MRKVFTTLRTVAGYYRTRRGEQWKKEQRGTLEGYEDWVDAQLFSEKASKEYSNFQNMLIPINIELVKQNVVETIWKYTDLVCAFD